MPTSAPHTAPIEAPIKLPRFTFISGATADRHALAAALSRLDDALAVHDLAEPLRRATVELFFGGIPTVDLNDYTTIPDFAVNTATWLAALESFLADPSMFGPGILGRLAISDLEVSGLSLAVFERWLFRDADEPADIATFVSRFGVENCLCLHLASGVAFASIHAALRHVYLHGDNAAARVAYLRTVLR